MIPIGQYKKSSFSGNGGCVEVGRLENGNIAIHDSKNPDKPAIDTFTPEFWRHWMREVKNGDFDIEDDA